MTLDYNVIKKSMSPVVRHDLLHTEFLPQHFIENFLQMRRPYSERKQSKQERLHSY